MVHRHAPGDEWGIAAFTGRSAELADATHRPGRALHARSRAAATATASSVIGSRRARAPGRATTRRGWRYFGSPGGGAVTITVTEAGYLRGADGGLDARAARGAGRHRGAAGRPAAPVRTAPARLLAGLAARRRADAGPLAIVPCDNVAGQRRRCVARVVARPRRAGRPGPARLAARVRLVRSTTMVDRITPRTTPEDVRAVARGHRAPTTLPGRHRAVQRVGAQRRVPGAGGRAGRTRARRSPTTSRRSSSASCGCSTARTRCWPTPARSAATRPWPRPSPTTTCRGWLQQWWAEASRAPDLPAEERRAPIAPRCSSASRTRACGTGSPRSPPTARRSCRSGSCPCCAPSAPRAGCPRAPTRVLAAWVCHLRGAGAPVADARADEVVAARRRPAAGGGAGASSTTSTRRSPPTTRSWRGRRCRASARDGCRDAAGRGHRRPRRRHDRRQGRRVRRSGRPGAGWRSASTRCSSPRPASRCRTPRRSSTATGDRAGRVRRGRGRRRRARDRAEHRDARADRRSTPTCGRSRRSITWADARAREEARSCARSGQAREAAPAQRRARALR